MDPGVSVEVVRDNTGFDLIVLDEVPTTTAPNPTELDVLRTRIDLDGLLRRLVSSQRESCAS